MGTESLAVLVLTLVISYFSLRAGRRGTALSVLPLVLLPSLNLVGGWASPQLARLGGTPIQWRILFVVVGLAAQVAVLGGISRAITKKGIRRTYLGMCGGFSVVFALLILFRLLSFT